MKTNRQQLWHLNSSWGEHNLATIFIAQDFWEIDPSQLGDKVSTDKIEKILCNDVVHLISYSRNVCKTTEAVGVVTGIHYKLRKVYVTWQRQKHQLREYHTGIVRPIIGPFFVKRDA